MDHHISSYSPVKSSLCEVQKQLVIKICNSTAYIYHDIYMLVP